MTLDPSLAAALQEAVAESGQPSTVSGQLEAWLQAITDGDIGLDDQAGRYKAICEEIVLKGPKSED